MNPRSTLEDVGAYYDAILPFYEKESIARAHLHFWTGLAKRWRPSRILELGAGLGRITTALARLAPAVGIDIGIGLLRRARQQVPKRSPAHFVAADMRRPALGGRFDLIVAPSDPFSHLLRGRDRRRALRAAAQRLSTRGRFVLEGLYRPRDSSPIVKTRQVRHSRGTLSIAETWTPLGAGLWRACYHYHDRSKGRRDRELEATFVARAWNPRTVRRTFASCGLAVEETWGDLDRRPFWPGAPRLIVVARP